MPRILDFGDLTIERDCSIAMRDGAILRADVYRPTAPGRYPVLLQRTPYNKVFAQTGVYQHPSWYARQGYIVVIQDVRGRYASDGVFDPYRREAEDGADTIAWAASAQGATGRVGTFGFSYAGANQILAAGEAPPGLACAAIGCAGDDFYDGWTYRGGALQLGFIISWVLQALAAFDAVKRDDRAAFERVQNLAADMHSAYRRPLADWIAFGELPKYFEDWIRHDTRDAFWRDIAPSRAHDAIRVPCLHIGGWFDIFVEGTIANFCALRMKSELQAASIGEQALLIGPWQHVPWARINGAVDYGPIADNRVDLLQLAWFDRWLKDRPADRAIPSVRYFLMGANTWVDADSWPPKGARACELFLHSFGRAASLSGDGRLSNDAPDKEPSDVFVYDPRNPVASLGGASCCVADVAPIGSFDQQPVEIRNDVLVYTSAPLVRACDVVGPVELVLYAVTDGPDTDWTGKLVDVHPDGRAMNLCDGVVRARYRDSLEQPTLLEPGVVYEYRIRLSATANRFELGHRVRLEISSSNFPTYDVNGNTGHRGSETVPWTMRLATQMVLHNREHASRLVLNVAQDSQFVTE
jgi:hypothetical protein